MNRLNKWIGQAAIVLGTASIIAISGCGGGGGGTTGGGGSAPSAQTRSDAASAIAGFGQGLACNSFAAYGPKLVNHGAFFDPILGLWAVIRQGPSVFQEQFFQDEATTLDAGLMNYKTVDITQSRSGPMTVTSGRFNGLTGVFNQTLQSGGFNGSISYTLPGVGTTNSQFVLVLGSSGEISGTATIGVAFDNGYTQNQQATYHSDNTFAITSTDSNHCALSLSFLADYSGTGTVTGTDPGLPATLKWNGTGSGSIKYADGSVTTFTLWQLKS